MAQPYVYAHPPGTVPSASRLPQGGGVARVIVDPRFCVPDPVDLAMVRDNIDFKHGNFDIRDVNGNMLFQSMTLHHRLLVFRGVSTEECDLLYTVKKSKMQHKKHTRKTALSGLDNFSVTVNPNFDYAFIASLLVLFDVINRFDPPKGIGSDNFEYPVSMTGMLGYSITVS
ncbi:hypothetical protein Bca52824_014484 [Brassica carinata]|uniref:Uncharacterized protein n=1 Tax=Brassica carinata TaxID=52824 RepID=A0A8X7W0V2_BRACI|nr:hypothetical protein Bca52824_014484 [Brassica carinata]